METASSSPRDLINYPLTLENLSEIGCDYVADSEISVDRFQIKGRPLRIKKGEHFTISRSDGCFFIGTESIKFGEVSIENFNTAAMGKFFKDERKFSSSLRRHPDRQSALARARVLTQEDGPRHMRRKDRHLRNEASLVRDAFLTLMDNSSE